METGRSKGSSGIPSRIDRIATENAQFLKDKRIKKRPGYMDSDYTIASL